MVEIVAARFGFGWGWDLGEDLWKDGVDKNFRMNDMFTGLTVISDALTAPPGSPADGDTYLVKATATGAWATFDGKIASWQNGVWYFYAVAKGLRGLFVNHGDFRVYDGSAWGTENTYARLPAEVQNIPMAFPFVGQPASGLTIYIPIVQDTDIPADFAGSIGYSNVNAAGTAVANIGYIRSGTPTAIGTFTFTSSGSLATPSTQALLHLLANDILTCSAPSPQNAALSDFTITLLTKKV